METSKFPKSAQYRREARMLVEHIFYMVACMECRLRLTAKILWLSTSQWHLLTLTREFHLRTNSSLLLSISWNLLGLKDIKSSWNLKWLYEDRETLMGRAQDCSSSKLEMAFPETCCCECRWWFSQQGREAFPQADSGTGWGAAHPWPPNPWAVPAEQPSLTNKSCLLCAQQFLFGRWTASLFKGQLPVWKAATG